MAVILLVCAVLAVASAAPPVSDGLYRDWQQELFDRMESNKLQDVYPAKRSNYGGLYISPCAAAASNSMAAYTPAAGAPIPAYASSGAAPYSYSHAAYQAVPAHQAYAPPHYSHPYYRTEDELQSEQEMLGFTDNHVSFDHVPMARYSYGAAPATGNIAPSSSGPVVGVFSNANVRDCSVPLLVTCSPSIAHGRIVKAQPYYNSPASSTQPENSYRGVDEHHEEPERHQETAAHSSEHSPHTSKLITDKHQ